jgi:hypothetical protein
MDQFTGIGQLEPGIRWEKWRHVWANRKESFLAPEGRLGQEREKQEKPALTGDQK